MNNGPINNSFARYGSWPSVLVLLLLCLGSRLLTTIYYIADPDSLRFAYAATEFDLESLRPHFPGYPVFCFFVQVLTSVTGKFSIAFSLIGGAATFFIIHYLLKLKEIARWNISSWIIVLFVFLNPMIWIMGNRYMPDLAGLAVAVAAAYYFYKGRESERSNLVFIFLAGILAGTRLSYLPVLLLPAAWSLFKRGGAWRQLLAGALGVLIWLVPMIIDTGWDKLVEIATKHTDGHFNDWGGTIETESSLAQRALFFAESIIADGMGGWWAFRDPVTFWFSILLLALCIAALFFFIRSPRTAGAPEIKIIWLSVAVYAAWVFFFQNIIYNSRHIMPLLLPVLLVMSFGLQRLIDLYRPVIVFAIGMFILNASITITLAWQQHSHPSALVQASFYLQHKCDGNTAIVSTELVNYYLSSTGLECDFITIRKQGDELPYIGKYSRVISVGNFELKSLNAQPGTWIFHHNPFVNRIWSTVEVREYSVAK